jgi:hypothetical protein
MCRKGVRKDDSRDDTEKHDEDDMDVFEIDDCFEQVDKDVNAKTTVRFNGKWYPSAPLYAMTILFRGKIPEVICITYSNFIKMIPMCSIGVELFNCYRSIYDISNKHYF